MRFSKNFLETLRELLALVGGDNLQEIEIERRFLGGGRIRIVKGGDLHHVAPMQTVSASHVEPSLTRRSEATKAEDVQPNEETDGLHPVLSPMVGMFYASPDPESPAFVEEGDIVSAGQTLCIIEAMKIMNEIETDIKGRVVRVLAENGKPVEYNTPLFLLEPL